MSDLAHLEILLFHGVVPDNVRYEVRNYNRKHIPVSYFADFLQARGSRGAPVSMDQVLNAADRDVDLPPGAFAVTFDDGFENNVSVAAPVLREMNIPATFYVTSNFVENNTMSWIDRIEWAFEGTERVKLLLPWAKKSVSAASPEEKIPLLDEIRVNAKADPTLKTDDLVTSIFSQLGIDEVRSSNEPIDKKMTWDQVAAIAAEDLFTIGGHTHTHKVLSYLSEDELAFEIDTSMDLITQAIGRRPVHYAYPEGLAYCYSPDVVEALKGRGILCCPTAIPGSNPAEIGLFDLRRNLIT